MAAQFQTQRSEDAIIISPQIRTNKHEFKEPISKKQRNSEESPSNPLHPADSLKRPNCMFFKTRLCLKFRCGSCTNGSDCNFAHGSEELRRPPPNWHDFVAKDGSVNERQMFVENQICKKFYRGGVCSYGERCTFMHVEPGMLGEGSSVSKGKASMLSGDDNGGIGKNSESIVVVGRNEYNQKTIFRKTRMCNRWETMGHCSFGDKCHFAHGHAELMKFRSHMEFDKVNIAAAPLKPHLHPIKVVSASTTMSCVKRQTPGFLKWEGIQKISHIYADWIDDIPLHLCSSPSEAGT